MDTKVSFYNFVCDKNQLIINISSGKGGDKNSATLSKYLRQIETHKDSSRVGDREGGGKIYDLASR